MKLVAVALLLSTLGCESTESKCEKAEKVYMQVATAKIEEVMATVADEDKAELRDQSEAELKAARKNFVPLCKALDDKGLECITRFDKFQKAEERYHAARAECADDECRDKARAEFENTFDDCKDTLEPFFEKLYEGVEAP